jgi:hypothetical protein
LAWMSDRMASLIIEKNSTPFSGGKFFSATGARAGVGTSSV